MSNDQLSWRDYCDRLGENYDPPTHDPNPLLVFLRHPLGYADLLLRDFAATLDGKGTVRLFGVLERIGIVIAVFLFYFELQDRESERLNRAWSIIAQAPTAQGNIGLQSALQTLHSDGQTLAMVRLFDAFLLEVRLPKADLRSAVLSRATLVRADLVEADLSWVKLIDADLREADLRAANLTGADLNGAFLDRARLEAANLRNANLIAADLGRANMRGANLSDANLSGAKLKYVLGLSADMLMAGCAKSYHPPEVSDDFRDVQIRHCD